MTEFEQAVYHLISVWRTYGQIVFDGTETDVLYHRFMNVGEDATDFLVKHGYGIEVGRGMKLTQKALDLLDKGD